MLSLEIRINGKIIHRATARRIHPKKVNENSLGVYVVNEGDDFIEHTYGQGAKELGRRLYPYLIEVTPTPEGVKERVSHEK
jgi:hypothetical protein